MQSLRAALAHGPISFERFMEIALYGEGGFFRGETIRSVSDGDFLTSPEVSSLFGVTLAEFVRQEHRRLGEPFRLVDVGAGSGSLLRSLLAEYPVEAWAVEVSPPARARLVRLVPADRVVSSLAELPSPLRGVVVANELIDNLPMALAQKMDGRWRERWVGLEGDTFVMVDADPRPEVLDWLHRFAGPVAEGGWVEVQSHAQAWLSELLGRLIEGSVVIVDYGELAENLSHRREAGTLRTYRGHHLGPDPLLEPGTTDITADVNFTALIATAEAGGWTTELLRQDEFLRHHGLGEQLAELRQAELVAAGTTKQLKLRSERLAGETLLHERGLGDFRVLVVRNG
ncbi:MAG: SAM-dependent methyltransferase [Actinobacteria bacterium]|nr:SAM-dependent methyltransferase [Actinomycetota bacterium]